VFTPWPRAQPATPATPHPETHFADPCSPSTCREPGCPHVNYDDGTGPLPTFIWRSQGCLYAWHHERNRELAQQEQAAS
jgi:hypothetical protein